MTDTSEKYSGSIVANMGPREHEPHRPNPTFLNRLAYWHVAGLRYVGWQKT